MKKKIILNILVLLIVFIILIVSAGYFFGFVPATISNSSEKNQPYSPTIPPSSNPLVAPFSIITFDFDKGTPTVLEGQNTPFVQASGGLTASFSSDSDPAAFSIQSYKSTFYALPEFSGKYLFDNKITRDRLYIAFSQPINEIKFTFASIELEGPGHIEEPSMMKLTLYTDSISNTPVGEAYARANFSTSSFPQGTMSFDSQGKPFNLIKMELLYQLRGGTDFLIDNIIVTIAS